MSVRKRRWPDAKTGPNEAWVADYVDGNGKRHRKQFARKKDADAFVTGAKVEVRDGIHVPDSATITVGEAGRLWLLSGEAAGLERTTIDQRRQHLALHIKPLLGDTKLNKVAVPSVRAFQDDLRAGGRSPAMIKRVTVSLGSIFADAQDRGLIIRNPVHEKSRARSGKAAEKRGKARLQVGVDIPTTTEIKALLDVLTGRWRPLLVTMIFTGIRASEARGLRWIDVDLENKVLHVRQRADRYRDIGMPKTEAGQRSIPLPPMAVNALKEWKLACPRGKEGLVFPNTEGGVEFHQNMLQRGLLPAWLASGVTVEKINAEGEALLAPKYPGFHALRHWFASWCINRRADGGRELSPKQVQERMGHGSIQVTYDTYGHLFPVPDEHAEMAADELRLFAVSGTQPAQADKIPK